jgi:hypothetical protein
MGKAEAIGDETSAIWRAEVAQARLVMMNSDFALASQLPNYSLKLSW